MCKWWECCRTTDILWEFTFAEPLIQFNHFRLLIYIHVWIQLITTVFYFLYKKKQDSSSSGSSMKMFGWMNRFKQRNLFYSCSSNKEIIIRLKSSLFSLILYFFLFALRVWNFLIQKVFSVICVFFSNYHRI